MKKSLKPGKKGIVAVSTLWISIILSILIVALLSALKAESGHVLRYSQRTELLYIAEAGIADAARQLSDNNEWKPLDPIVYEFPNGRGKYTIKFDQDGYVSPDESVNNLENTYAVNGPRGTGTVPPNTADVVVVAEFKGQTVRYEALISRGFSEPVTVPLLASGKIKMEGALEVAGIKSLTDRTPVLAGIHSNDRSDVNGIITWNKLTDKEAYIDGSVTTSSGNAGAVEVTSGFFPREIETGQGAKGFPLIDIDRAVRLNRNLTALTPSTTGPTVVSDESKYFSGGKVSGDLVLNGVNLYVDGDLEVNGSITGSGSIYVTGNTSFKGSTDLRVNEDKGLGLISKGHVRLEGFAGTEFLDDIAKNHPDFQALNEAAKVAFEGDKEADPPVPGIKDIITKGKFGAGGGWGNDNAHFEELRAVLGGGPQPPTDPDTPIDPDAPPAVRDALGQMVDYIRDHFTPSPTTEFLQKRLKSVRQLYAEKEENSLDDKEVLANFKKGSGNYSGILDILNESSTPTHLDLVKSLVDFHNFDKLGTSYFQGVIYTTGAVYAKNDIEIFGALLAENKGSSPGSITVGGVKLQAGDIAIVGGSKLIYNSELLENPFVGQDRGPVQVQAWLGIVE